MQQSCCRCRRDNAGSCRVLVQSSFTAVISHVHSADLTECLIVVSLSKYSNTLDDGRSVFLNDSQIVSSSYRPVFCLEMSSG